MRRAPSAIVGCRARRCRALRRAAGRPRPPRDRAGGADPLAGRPDLRAVRGADGGRPALDLLPGPAGGERHARLAPRRGPGAAGRAAARAADPAGADALRHQLRAAVCSLPLGPTGGAVKIRAWTRSVSRVRGPSPHASFRTTGEHSWRPSAARSSPPTSGTGLMSPRSTAPYPGVASSGEFTTRTCRPGRPST